MERRPHPQAGVVPALIRRPMVHVDSDMTPAAFRGCGRPAGNSFFLSSRDLPSAVLYRIGWLQATRAGTRWGIGQPRCRTELVTDESNQRRKGRRGDRHESLAHVVRDQPVGVDDPGELGAHEVEPIPGTCSKMSAVRSSTRRKNLVRSRIARGLIWLSHGSLRSREMALPRGAERRTSRPAAPSSRTGQVGPSLHHMLA